ncbi:gamma-glutamylcyclotransferase family protein [Roseibaca sp. Y0-43]|uniref:gamma-glutamylcyclotransferase family protein n=1 Tax=Roseibaca sp. Y0-43 TaxID=2816854 RepID=UPI001D0C75D9|nr:gamma-glutamylcyclotransferase family protein [Roseibaca sp. Y0-43]
MTDAFFFGYGSLVNRLTHDYPDAQPVTIRGWRREWRMAHRLRRTFLSVVPDASVQIDGLVARVPGQDWAALDVRETGYARHPLGAEAFARGPARPAQIYAIDPAQSELPSHAAPIKLSYLDVVAEGFAQEFGQDGVARFLRRPRAGGRCWMTALRPFTRARGPLPLPCAAWSMTIWMPWRCRNWRFRRRPLPFRR